ncbi:MAG: hypothetical protein M3O30_08450 [Planctomycetota bacterium]|nr:hypothetical protein [Planctomycetota bacterium]
MCSKKRPNRKVNAILFAAAMGAMALQGPNIAIAAIPALNSRAGATYTIYLDFGGFSFDGNWGNNPQYAPGDTPAYDDNGNSSAIQTIWSVVAQKYSAFNINVTTVDPAVAAGQTANDLARQNYYDSQADLMHTVIGGSGSWLPNAGGVSYLSVTPNVETGTNGLHTNFVFSGLFGAITDIGEAVSHENGHGFGLSHQSDYSGNTLVHEYSSGTNLLAPTMGSSYSKARGLFALGTAHVDDSGPTQQNDAQIIANDPGMGGFVDDAIGHTLASATAISRTGSFAINSTQSVGVIVPANSAAPVPVGSANYTADWWSFDTTGGSMTLNSISGQSTLTAGAADPGATLNTTLDIFDSNGNLVASSATSSLSETISRSLSAGSYYAEVLAAGDATDPSSNNRGFFDMGSYFLSGNIPLSPTDSWNTTSGGNWTDGANWTVTVAPFSAQDVFITNTFSGTQTIVFTSTANRTYNSLTVDATGGGTNVLSMSTNKLTTSAGELFGFNGKGSFNQSGGTNSVSGIGVFLGYNPGSTGTYTLASSATLSVNNSFEYIGYSGSGNFNQTGGANSLTGNMFIGYHAGSTGTYSLTGGVLNASNVYVGGTDVSAGGIGTLTVGGAGQMNTSGTLQIWNKGTVILTGPSTAFTTIGNVQIAAGGLLDVTNTGLTINYGTAASPNAAIQSYIASGYNSGSALWTGKGITSSAAALDPVHHSVAFADGADGVVINLPAGVSSVIPNGGVLPAGTELVTYANAGDANVDGKVDFSDFVILSNHYGGTFTNWDQGNFNYDTTVDFSDFVILSNNFGAGVTGGNGTGATPLELAQYNALAATFGISNSQIAAWDATIASLPEPGIAGLLVIGAPMLLIRRRYIAKT